MMPFILLEQSTPPASPNGPPLGQLLVLLLALLAVVIVGLVVVTQVKKRMQASDSNEISAGFTLSDLRRLHKTGQMSTEEYEKAKARVVDAARRAAERDAKPVGKPDNGEDAPAA